MFMEPIFDLIKGLADAQTGTQENLAILAESVAQIAKTMNAMKERIDALERDEICNSF